MNDESDFKTFTTATRITTHTLRLFGTDACSITDIITDLDTRRRRVGILIEKMMLPTLLIHTSTCSNDKNYILVKIFLRSKKFQKKLLINSVLMPLQLDNVSHHIIP